MAGILKFKILRQLIFITLIFCFYLKKIDAEVRLTNVKCKSYDESFATFEYCFLKAVNRSYKYVSLKVNLLQTPINNASVSFWVEKRANGYKPFLYSGVTDACDYLRNKARNPVLSFIFKTLETSSNMNHTCPYNHDLIVEKLDTAMLENQFIKMLPFPEGDYVVNTAWYAYNVHRANYSIYFTVRETFFRSMKKKG